MQTQDNKDLDGSWRNTRDSAGTQHQLKFKPKEVRTRRDQTEISALAAQLEDSQYQQHLYHCRWAAAERKSCDFKAQLEEVQSKLKYSAAEAEVIIKELKEQLERASSSETRSYEEEIHRLKFELKEAGVGRINAVNRLILADTIMASLNLRLDERQNRTPAEEPRPGSEELQQQLLKTQRDLEEQAAKHREDREALCCQIQELRAKLCTAEALREETELKAQDLEEEVKKIKASNLAQLEQQEENAKMGAAVQRAEEEVLLQQTLQDGGEERAQREAAMKARMDGGESTVEETSEGHLGSDSRTSDIVS